MREGGLRDVASHYRTRPCAAEAEAIGRLLYLEEGEIQTVSTDHCSFTLAQKELGREDFRKIPGGMPGVETRGIIMYSEGVRAGRISREKMCEVLCENPAKLYGLYPHKGVIQKGADADLVLLDPAGETFITKDTQVSRCDYAPLEGRTLTGAIRQVYLRGEAALENGAVTEARRGKFLRRGPYQRV